MAIVVLVVVVMVGPVPNVILSLVAVSTLRLPVLLLTVIACERVKLNLLVNLPNVTVPLGSLMTGGTM